MSVLFKENAGVIACVICVAVATFWAYKVFAVPRILVWWRRRQRRLERANQQPFDVMTRHLEHGEIPHLTDDGEIAFEKRLKHVPSSRDEL
jgi:hypothetical protein